MAKVKSPHLILSAEPDDMRFDGNASTIFVPHA
jgi:hypothetical protein